MNADFFFKFGRFKIGKLAAAEDFSDKFNYQYTTTIILMAMAIVAIKQYAFTPLHCWIPAEWNRNWEDYTENFCWIENTYYSTVDMGPYMKLTDRGKHKLGYYQWVPFILALQMLLYYLPHVIWKVLNARIGGNMNQLIRFANDCAILDSGKRSTLLIHLAKHTAKMLETRTQFREIKETQTPFQQKWQKLQRIIRMICPCFWFGKRTGFYLVSVYFFVKLLYIANNIGQLYVMQKFLGFNSTMFGFEILSNLLNDRDWQHSGMFPRVTWCDVFLRKVGNAQRYSVQCVLPVNMLNEKIYIFLWFWVMFALAATVFSLFLWIVRVAFTQSRKTFIKRYLKLLNTVSPELKPKRNEFVAKFLNHDGVFLLRMVASNVGDMVAAELVQEIWYEWTGTRPQPAKAEAPPKKKAAAKGGAAGKAATGTAKQPASKQSTATAPPLPSTASRGPKPSNKSAPNSDRQPLLVGMPPTSPEKPPIT